MYKYHREKASIASMESISTLPRRVYIFNTIKQSRKYSTNNLRDS